MAQAKEGWPQRLDRRQQGKALVPIGPPAGSERRDDQHAPASFGEILTRADARDAMHIAYSDIVSRIPETPLWWLEGVPRYDAFRPDQLCVYAKEALLVHIRCQACGADFHIGLFDPRGFETPTFKVRLLTHREIDVGDPPNACCSVGAAMGAEEIAILQFWERKDSGWVRMPELERGMTTSDEELVEGHREAWRRIRLYSARPNGFVPEWTPLPAPPEFPPSLPNPIVDRSMETNGYIDWPSLNARRRRAVLALTGRISADEFQILETMHQREFGAFESRPPSARPSWAEPLADEIRHIDETVLASAIAGFHSMTQDERDECYCHGLDQRLYRLAHTGRIGQEERSDLWRLLLRGRYSR